MLIRSTHPAAFKSGEWAQVVNICRSTETKRLCYDVVFEDGNVDTWPCFDPYAAYEYQEGVTA